MTGKKYLLTHKDRLLKILAGLIIVLGTVTRVVVYLQNRNLFIDEANLARNIYEKGFRQLAMPLSYEQYAPPIFLWITKISTLLFGFSEYAFRIYPLLAGIGALFILVLIMKEIASFESAWYPLFLMTVGFIFIRYSSELKQYMCDALIVLSLILLALKTDIQKKSPVSFTLLWFISGSVAIWACMPAIFALAAVGLYYLYISLHTKNYKGVTSIILTGTLWMAQFAFYYFTILKPQADSSYLQNFHKDYFLYLLPDGKEQLMHNWYTFKSLLQESGGYPFINWCVNLLLMLWGSIYLLRKEPAKGILLILPLAGALLAAALHEYSLIPRVALFMMPLILLLVGVGFDRILHFRFIPLQVLMIIIAIWNVKNFSMLRMMIEPHKNEEITEGLTLLKAKNITGDHLFVNNGAGPAFIYYTQMHPQRQQWNSLKAAHLLSWETNYDSLAQHLSGTNAFIYTASGIEEVMHYKSIIAKYQHVTDSIENASHRCYTYIYVKN